MKFSCANLSPRENQLLSVYFANILTSHRLVSPRYDVPYKKILSYIVDSCFHKESPLLSIAQSIQSYPANIVI